MKHLVEPIPDKSHCLTREQADKLIEVCAPHRKPIASFMLEVGSRIGETLLMEWSHLDLTPGLETVTFPAENTKSGKDRSVALTPTAVAVLREVGKVRYTAHDRVFSFRGKPLGKVQSSWNTAKRLAGLPTWATPHVARRTAATWAREAGADLGWLQDVLGHADARQTLRYAKPTDICRRFGVGKMGRNPAGGHTVDTKAPVDATESAS